MPIKQQSVRVDKNKQTTKTHKTNTKKKKMCTGPKFLLM